MEQGNARPRGLVITIAAIVCGVIVAASVGAQASAPAAAANLDGTLTMVSGSTLGITTTTAGMRVVLVNADTLVLQRRAVTPNDIQVGDALGVAAIRNDDGSLTATVINVFPQELWQRVRKGQFPMQSGQIMTNAKVESYVSDAQGHRIVMPYEGGSATISVPDSAEVFRSVAIPLGELKPGMHVMVRGATQADGSLAAGTISADAN